MIKRELLRGLEAHLQQKEITLLVGSRQVGKTTLMKLLQKKQEETGQETVFFNLDIERERRFFNSQEELLEKIKLELGEERGIVFIDEIQRKENAGLFLKGLYDSNLPYKFVVSGSGSMELKEKIHESLAGRKRVFRLETLSFSEFVNYRTANRYEGRLAKFFKIEKEEGERLLREYLEFGGYPRVVLAQTREEKLRIIDEIYNSYLEKDISSLLKVEKTEAFTELLRLMAVQAGKLVSYEELSSTLNITYQTVKNYLWYLQKTFILYKVSPFYRNPRKEITKAPVFYFSDLGLCNYAAATFGHSLVSGREGFLFQNFVYLDLIRRTRFTPYRINYWRTKFKSEVDFIFNAGEKLFPLEVKFARLQDARLPNSLRSFISAYQPKKAFIVNLGLEKKVKLGKTEIEFISFSRFLWGEWEESL